MILIWAFIWKPDLTPDGRALGNGLFAIACGGSFVSGMARLRVRGQTTSRFRFMLDATGGIAVMLVCLFYPLFRYPQAEVSNLPTGGAAGRPVPPRAGSIMLTDPANDSGVGDTIDVRGVTSFPGMRHYLLVKPQLGAAVLQDEPMEVTGGRNLTGRARLGNSAVGAGQDYIIWVVATQATLVRAPSSLPADAKSSDPIKVKRKPKGA